MTENDAIFQLMEYTRGLSPNHIYYRPCNTILRQLSNLQNYSIHSLAELCFVSPTTLSRLSRELGYSSFQEFKITMVAAYRYAMSLEDLDRQFRTPRKDAAIPEEVRALNFLDYVKGGIDQLHDFVMCGDALKHVQLIRRCSRVVFYISAGLDIIPFAKKLITCGKPVSILKGDISNILKPDAFSPSSNELSDTCYILSIRLKSEMESLIPHMHTIKEAGGTVIAVYPDFLTMDKDIPDHYFAFQSLNTLGDDIAFQGYLDTISTMF